MILYNLYKQRINEQIEKAKLDGRSEGRAEGVVEVYQLWTAWNNRRIEAEGKNIPFNEPPPPPPIG